MGVVLMIRSTLTLYREAAVDTFRATARSGWAFVLLLLLYPVLTLVAMLVSPLGIIGGFAVGLLNAACAGTYLATLQDALEANRSLSISTVRQNLGRYTSEVIGVAFPIWIGSMIVNVALPGPVAAWLMLGVAVVFNVAPEMIGRTRSAGTAVLVDSVRWLRENGPEWFVPQLLLLVPVLVLRPGAVGDFIGMFGPLFGFVNAGGLALGGGGGPAAWAVGLALVVFVHASMLFRGALYKRLGSGGRRQRAWRARIGG